MLQKRIPKAKSKVMTPRFSRTCRKMKASPNYKAANTTSSLLVEILRMRKSRARALTWFLVWLIIVSHETGALVCQDEEKPSMFQLLSNTLSSLKKPHQSYWEKTKAVVHEFQLHFAPPRLDFRGAGAAEGAGEKVKAAVKDVIGISEAVAEETAKSAAEAVHKTAEAQRDCLCLQETRISP